MKNFLILVTVMLSTTMFLSAQIGNHVLDFQNGIIEKIKIGEANLEFKKSGGNILFRPTGKTDDVRIQLIQASGKLVEIDETLGGGPFEFLRVNAEKKNTIVLEGEEEVAWPVLVIVAIVCIDADVSWTQTGGWSGSIGWDCPGLVDGGNDDNPEGPVAITFGEEEYSNIVGIRFVNR